MSKIEEILKNIEFLDYSPAACILADAGRRILHVNKAFERVFGFTKEEVLGKTTSFLYAEEANFIKTHKRYSSQQKKIDLEPYEMKYLKKDGSILIGLTVGSPVLNDKNEVVGMLGTIIDNTKEKEYGDKLKQSEELLKSIVEHSFDGYWDWHIEKNYEYMSPRFWEMFGYDYREKTSSPKEWMDIIFQEDLPIALENYDKHVKSKGKDPYTQEVRYKHKNGKTVWVMCRGKVIEWSQDGKPLRMVGTHTDITKLKEQEVLIASIKDKMTFALEVAGIGVWSYNPSSEVLYWDKTMHEIYGTDPEKFSNKYEEWRQRVYPKDLPKVEYNLQKALAEQSIFSSTFRIKLNGSIRYIKTAAKGNLNSKGELIEIVGINWDGTEEVLQKNLLTEAKQKAEDASAAKSGFLSNMSHEIRTPLNGILGYCDLLSESKLNLEDREKVKIIEESSNSLMSIINDILDYSKVESGRMPLNPEPENVAEELMKVYKLFLASLKDDVELIFDTSQIDSQIFYLDTLRLRQIVTNIVGNSMKFTEKGYIRLSVSYDKNMSKLHFIVEDTGCGIPQNKISNIFETFVQKDESTTKKYGGTGLGLAICRSLVTLMSGRIFCESEEGVGTKFFFDIYAPLKSSLDKPISKIQNSSSQASKNFPINILVVEDSLINQKLIQARLGKYGSSVDVVNDGFECLKILEKKSYDLILMDISMPGMNGYKTTQKIRLSENMQQPVIYALTAHVFEEDKKKALDHGMDGHLSKPFKKEDLEAVLSRCKNLKEKA